MKFVNVMRTLGQKVRYPAAINRPVFLRISKGGVEGLATVTMAGNKEASQTNTEQGHKHSRSRAKKAFLIRKLPPFDDGQLNV
jgi:hypothetical protein